MPPKYFKETRPRPIVHHHIVLKPHHKWILGGLGTVVIVFMITISIFVYLSFVRQELSNSLLEKKISDTQKSTQAQIDEMSSTLLGLQGSLEESQQGIGCEIPRRHIHHAAFARPHAADGRGARLRLRVQLHSRANLFE